jgi:anti-sigma regulatory factor (Ser/Thr protein kinase)
LPKQRFMAVLNADRFSVRVRFDARGASLARVRAVVETVLKTEPARSFAREEIDEVLLGLQESLTNVARHAYPRGEPAIVDLLVRADGGRFQARIRDRGCAFAPRAAESAPAPEASPEPRPSGYGLVLMGRTMDRVAYRRRAGTNYTRMERRARFGEPEPISIKRRPVRSR